MLHYTHYRMAIPIPPKRKIFAFIRIHPYFQKRSASFFVRRKECPFFYKTIESCERKLFPDLLCQLNSVFKTSSLTERSCTTVRSIFRSIPLVYYYVQKTQMHMAPSRFPNTESSCFVERKEQPFLEKKMDPYEL